MIIVIIVVVMVIVIIVNIIIIVITTIAHHDITNTRKTGAHDSHAAHDDRAPGGVVRYLGQALRSIVGVSFYSRSFLL